MIDKISYGDMVRAENVTIGNVELHNTLDKKTIEDFNRPLENLFYNDQEMLQIFENFTKNLYSDDVILQNSSYSNFEMTLADDIFILNNICYIRLTPGIVLKNSSDVNGKIIINYPNVAVAQRQLEKALDLNTTFGAESVEIKYIPELDIFKARIKTGVINNPSYTYYTKNSNTLSEWNDDTNAAYGYKSGVKLLNAILSDNLGAFNIANIKLETFVTNTGTYTDGTFYWVLNANNEFDLKINVAPTVDEFELTRFVATFNASAGTLTTTSTTQANTTFFNNANIVTDSIVNIETTTTDTVTLKNSAGSIEIDSDGDANFSNNLDITGDINTVVNINASGDIDASGDINGLDLVELSTGYSIEGGSSSSKTLTVDETKKLSDKQDNLTFGIANTNTVVINSADVADNDYAKFTSSGLEGRNYTEVREDLGLSITDDVVFGTVSADNADFGDIKIDSTNNVVENTAVDTSLIIRANGTGIINMPSNSLEVPNGITANLTGNADTATALESSFTVTFATGDVTGSFSTDGGSNVSNVDLTIEPDSVALGTQTTGNYVQQGNTTGNGISGSINSEGGTFTVTSNATSANTVSTIVFRDTSGNFAAGDITASEITTSVLDSNSAATWSLVDNNANALDISSGLLKINTTNEAEGISTNGYLTASGNITTSGDIKINGSTSGTITFSVPASAGTTAISFPATDGTVITSGDTKTVTNSMIADNAVFLSTQTTGDYVQTITGTTNQINIADDGEEGAGITISTPQDIDVNADIEFGSLLINDGNVTFKSWTTGASGAGYDRNILGSNAKPEVSSLNLDGGDLTISSGQSVGTGKSLISFKVPIPAGAAGTTLNALQEELKIENEKVTVANDLFVSGNLDVTGDIITTSTTEVNIGDSVMLLNAYETGTPSIDAGIEIERGTSSNVSILWDESEDEWTFGSHNVVASSFEGNLTGDVTGNVTTTSITSNSTAIWNLASNTSALNIESGLLVLDTTNSKVKTNGDIEITGDTVVINGLTKNFGSISLIDEADIVLPTGKSGFGFVQFETAAAFEYAQFVFTANGAVTLLQNSTNIDDADTDGKFCIFDNGTNVTISNRLAEAVTVRYEISYS